jgi:uncharacterized protein YndB with AHSA1/START domain
VPTVRRSRKLSAPQARVWDVVGDPHHLPRWWPRVSRVEAVGGGEFTEVLKGGKGKTARADFAVLDEQPPRRIVWSQLLDGTPFARVLKSAETEIELTPAADATEVKIELRQSLQAVDVKSFAVPWLGSWLVRRAAARTLEEALDGLERIVV